MMTLDLSKNQIADGLFVLTEARGEPYRWPQDGGGAFHFVGAYKESMAPIRDALLTMIRGAQRRIFVASFLIGDEALLAALIEAAQRLRGGVYIITALDKDNLRRGLAQYEYQDGELESPEEQGKNFERLTTNGVYVRGHESCHAKFAVVDEAIALVGSANFVAKAFEWTGEANVVVRHPAQVRQLARLFTRLWYDGCRWEVPPGKSYSVVQRQPSPSPAAPELPQIREPGILWSNGASETFLHQSICDLIASARRHLLLASYSVTGMSGKPHLLLEPLRQAVERGVVVQMFVRQKNPSRSQRADLCALADMGVEIHGDLQNHAKGIIADGERGALFSCNFDGQRGLDEGVEVGVRLDGDPALTEFENYLQHVIRHSNARYVRFPTLGDLDGRLAARWCRAWPLPHRLNLICSPTMAAQFTTAAGTGPVLFEKQGNAVHLFAGRFGWSLKSHGETFVVEPVDADVDVLERLELWLVSVQRPIAETNPPERGFCPATFTLLPQ